MTNVIQNDMGLPQRQAFLKLLATYGVTELHGVELLRLVHVVAHAYENIATANAEDGKISPPRWRLLVRLLMEEQAGGSYVYPTQLSKAQSVSKNTISAHLRSLEEQGLIVRELDPHDHRQFRIRLSDAGRSLIQRATPRYITFLNELAAGLTAAEIEQLQTLLLKLQASLLKHGRLEEQCEMRNVTSQE